MPRIEKRVTEEQKAAWLAYCKANGMSESGMMGLILDKVTSGQFQASPERKEPRSNKITIRLSDDEMGKTVSRATEEGFPNKTNWATQLVLSTISKKPVLTKEELYTLRESNRELSAIGRNLNQIARVLNIDFMESNKINQALLLGISQRIDAHKKEVSNLLNKSLNRWEQDNE